MMSTMMVPDDAADITLRSPSLVSRAGAAPGLPGGLDGDGHAEGDEGQGGQDVAVEHPGRAQLEQLGMDQVLHRTAPVVVVSSRKNSSRSKCWTVIS